MVRSLGRRYDPEHQHELRIRIRRLRYALELLAEADPGAPVHFVRLKPLQSRLGDSQDRIVLCGWLMAHAARLRLSDPALAQRLRVEASRCRTRAIRSRALFLKGRPGRVLVGLGIDRPRDA